MSASTLSSGEDAKAIVLGYFEDISAGRYDAARLRIAEDATWWVVGEGHWPIGGTYDKSGMRALTDMVRDRFPAGLQLTVHGAVADGDRVFVEAESHGTRRDGRGYNNNYIFIFTVRDGLIRHRREYCDMFHANDLLCGPMAEAASQAGQE